MALVPSGLSAVMFTKLSTDAPPSKPDELQKFCDDMAEAIIAYFIANTQVTVQGITPGPANAVGTIS